MRGDLAKAKRLLTVGSEWAVTNHYIKKPDSPVFGTTRRTVLKSTAKQLCLSTPGPHNSWLPWPLSVDVEIHADGMIRFYQPDPGSVDRELFLTFKPVTS